jgi:aminoglycoside phosphotransferase (APT) family kinase protein
MDSGRLRGVLAAIIGADVTIENLRVLTGGASRSTWAFDARTRAGARPLILRAGLPDWGHSPASGRYPLPVAGAFHAGLELEARVQALAAAAGAPVPNVLIAEDSQARLGVPFLICDAIAGETIPRKVLRHLDDHTRAELLRQCAHALAAIHRAEPDAPGLSVQDPLARTRRQLDDMGDTTATFEWAFRWLAANRPPSSPPRLVHGDFRMGNLIVNDAKLAAVLDWELVHIGEIYADLAWFCIRAWRFGAPASRGAGGLGSIDSFLSAYERCAATTVDRAAIRWWLILGTLRWGVICRYQAQRHLSGEARSVELAAIGRRVAETEWDILDLLGTRSVA